MSQRRYQNIAAVVCGNTLEYFDMLLYAQLLVVITPLFFPNSDPLIQKLESITSFSIAFLIRPIGSLLFGYLGDFFGRTIALTISLTLMAMSTLTIGLLPTYEQIGVSASTAILICRLIQGFSASGESVGASIYLVEIASPKRKCLLSSLVHVSTSFGGAIAAAMGFFFTVLLGEQKGWQYPFMIGGGIATIGFYMRYKLKETKDFCRARNETKLSFKDIFQKYKVNIFAIAGISTLDSAVFYLVFIYIPDFFKNELGLSVSYILGHSMIVLLFDMSFCVFIANLGDKFGSKKVVQFANLAFLIIAFPLFWLLASYKTYWVVTFVQLVLVSVGFGYSAPIRPFLVSLFPTIGRYTGYAFGWYLGRSLILGLSGYLFLFLSNYFSHIGPSLLLFLCAFISYFSLKIAQPYIEKSHESPDIIKASVQAV
ncbi:MAG: MFS transporter [Proteobacteria bacterium]|nr:MFS transporter [Pseudomonadota bacterium]